MEGCRLEQWIALLGAVGVLVGVIVKGIKEITPSLTAIIEALRGVKESIDTHEANAAARAAGKSSGEPGV
jgi:hypothetical protein